MLDALPRLLLYPWSWRMLVKRQRKMIFDFISGLMSTSGSKFPARTSGLTSSSTCNSSYVDGPL